MTLELSNAFLIHGCAVPGPWFDKLFSIKLSHGLIQSGLALAAKAMGCSSCCWRWNCCSAVGSTSLSSWSTITSPCHNVLMSLLSTFLISGSVVNDSTTSHLALCRTCCDCRWGSFNMWLWWLYVGKSTSLMHQHDGFQVGWFQDIVVVL